MVIPLIPGHAKAQYCYFRDPIGQYLANCCGSQSYNETTGCEEVSGGCNNYASSKFCTYLDNGHECEVAGG